MLSMQRASWEQGVVAQACFESGDVELGILMAKEAIVRQDAAGRLANLYSDQNVTDPAANGEPLLQAARHTGDPAFTAAAERMREYLVLRAPKSNSGVLYHMIPQPDGQMWSDSIYMAPPFMAAMGDIDTALQQLRGLRQLLWKPDKRLYAHIWNDSKERFEDESCWGVGNGWAAAGIARVLRYIPAAMSDERQELARHAREIIDGCLVHQRGDRFFHNVVDDPSTFVECNLAQMLAYAIYLGVGSGWLAPSYGEHAEMMRNAIQAQVDAFGLIQGVCGAPYFNGPGTAAEAQAFYVLMESARVANTG